ncbi:MAG TPA: hypothetical protein VIV40_27460 [Kofleriaceae bacterium]
MTLTRARVTAIADDVRARLGRHRRVVLVVCIAAFVVFAWSRVTDQARLMQPHVMPDSIVYVQTARQPLQLDHFFYPKPFAVPAIYRAFDADGPRIARFQLRFLIIAWSVFGIALCATLRRTRARVAAAFITLAFMLAPLRVGFSAALLSESIADSLMALLVAGAFGLALVARMPAGRRRTIASWVLTTGFACTALTWLFTRDTNAFTAVVAVVIAAALWGLHRAWRHVPWFCALAMLLVVASGFSLWTARQAPNTPTNLTLHLFTPAEYLPRSRFPIANNVILRIVPDPLARNYFVEHGLPQADELATMKDTWVPDERFFRDPHFEPARVWVAEHGASVYMKWLLAHPLDRADELVRHAGDLLAPQDMNGYMPTGWIYAYGFPGWAIRRTTQSEVVLLALFILLPFALRRPKRHVTTAIAAVLIGSGVIGAAAGYYGDAFEASRHMFGAGQQIVLGLFLAPLAWLDRQRSDPHANAAAGEPPREHG